MELLSARWCVYPFCRKGFETTIFRFTTPVFSSLPIYIPVFSFFGERPFDFLSKEKDKCLQRMLLMECSKKFGLFYKISNLSTCCTFFEFRMKERWFWWLQKPRNEFKAPGSNIFKGNESFIIQEISLPQGLQLLRSLGFFHAFFISNESRFGFV